MNGEFSKDEPVPTRTEGEGAILDLPEGLLAPGQVLGDRYQMKLQLGRGGMGEVWRAFDLKLRVEVGLKALLPNLDSPPPHTMPTDDFIAWLETLTNTRAVRDPASDTGWKLEVGPFPGWETVPGW